MKKNLFLFIIAITGSIACKKNNTDNPVPELPRIKTTTNSSGLGVTYKQDVQGRVTEAIYAGGSRDEFIYTTNIATINSYNTAGTLAGQTIYELNSEGLAVKEYAPGFPPGRIYEYDAGQRYTRYYSTSSNGDFSDNRFYYSATGLLDSSISKRTSAAGVLISHGKSIYEYSVNNNNTIGNYNYGYLFLGKNSVRLPNKIINMNILLGSQSESTYIYEYDSQNRVTKETRTSPNGSQQTITYTYY